MLAKLMFLLCLVAFNVHGYEEIIPTRTVQIEERSNSGACNKFYIEAKARNRPVGYVSFNSEKHASISRDQSAASILHFDSKGHLKQTKSFLGLGNLASTRGFHALGLISHTPKYTWTEELTYGDAVFCYSRTQNVIFGHKKNVPSSFKCSPVTFEKTCILQPPQPNPSDTVSHKTHSTRDLLQPRDAQTNRHWEAVRMNLAN